MTENVTLETDARGVATVRLSRPEVHNAYNTEMIAGLAAAVEAAASSGGQILPPRPARTGQSCRARRQKPGAFRVIP